MKNLACLLLVLLQAGLATSAHPEEELVRKGMYLPVSINAGELPSYFCYHFRKLCYVPGVSSGWRGWYRKGFSGYFIHGSWMYYMTRISCPCLFPQPPNPNTDRNGSLIQPY